MKCDLCSYEGEGVKPYQYTTYDEKEQVVTTHMCLAHAQYWGYYKESE